MSFSDSKLTRVLRESLGGRCKTVVVATISPSITAIEESVSTLNYAQSASGIVNKPISSSSIAVGEMPNFSDKKSPGECTIESWQEMEMKLQYMQTQVDEAQAALARKHIQQQELQDKVEKAEEKLLVKERQLYDAEKENKLLKEVVESETRKRRETETELHRTKIDLKETTLILKATQATEASLTTEARSLITKLEEIIAERNNLHSLIVSQREAECQRRQAALQLKQDAQVLISNIESSFSNLLTSIETAQSSAVDVATEGHKYGQQFLTETKHLLSELSENVVSVTESIKTLISGDDGILPSIQSNSDSVLSHIRSSSEAFIKGEEAMEKSHNSMRNSLTDCSNVLDERSSSIQSLANQTLQHFEEKVLESKNAISHLVLRIKSLITNHAQIKAEKVQELNTLLEQWGEQSIGNSKSLNDVATSSLDAYKLSIDEFESGLSGHKDIATSLEQQRSFINSHGSAHIQTIDQQKSILQAHCNDVKSSHQTQTELRNEVMASIMSGVQALVSAEMQKLASAETDNFKLLEKGSADLTGINNVMTESAHQMIESINSTNRSVSEKSSLLHSNDSKANEAMMLTSQTIEKVVSSSNSHQQLVSDFVTKSLSVVSEMKAVDGKSTEVINTAERDGKNCSACLVNGVFKPTASEMKKTAKSSLEAIADVSSSLIPDINGTLDDFVSKRKLLASQMSESFLSAENQLSNMKESVMSIANRQYDAADTLGRDVSSASNTHAEKVMTSYNTELDSAKDSLLSQMATMGEACTKLIAEGKVHGTSTSSSINEFSLRKMQCFEPVDPAPAKTDSTFCRELSVTPANDSILEGHGLNVQLLPENDSKLAANDDEERSQSSSLSEIETSLETQEDDNKSVNSVGSVTSMSAPRLTSRDINANAHHSHKPIKLHRPVGSSGPSIRKNKMRSGLPNPSRKRVKR